MIAFVVPGAPQGKGRVPVERLVELFSYEPMSGALCWRVDRGQRARKGEAAGNVSQQGYRVVGFANAYIAAKRQLHTHGTL